MIISGKVGLLVTEVWTDGCQDYENSYWGNPSGAKVTLSPSDMTYTVASDGLFSFNYQVPRDTHPGTLTFDLTAYDGSYSDTDTVTVTIQVPPMSVRLTIPTTSGPAPFSPSMTYDVEGGIGPYTVTVTFGAGLQPYTAYGAQSGPGQYIAPPTYSNPGSYTVTVTAVDQQGTTVHDAQTVEATAHLTATVNCPSSAYSGDTISLTSTVTASDGNNPQVSYHWSASPSTGSFDDPSVPAPKWTAPHVNAQTDYTISVSVSASGYGSDVKTCKLTVSPPPNYGPIVAIGSAITVAIGGGLLANQRRKRKVDPCLDQSMDEKWAKDKLEDTREKFQQAAEDLLNAPNDLSKWLDGLPQFAIEKSVDIATGGLSGAIKDASDAIEAMKEASEKVDANSTANLVGNMAGLSAKSGAGLAEYARNALELKNLWSMRVAAAVEAVGATGTAMDVGKLGLELYGIVDGIQTALKNIEDKQKGLKKLVDDWKRAKAAYDQCLKKHKAPPAGGGTSLTNEAEDPCGSPIPPGATISNGPYSTYYGPLPGESGNIAVGTSSKAKVLKPPAEPTPTPPDAPKPTAPPAEPPEQPVPWLRLPESSQVAKWPDSNVIRMDSGKLGLDYPEGGVVNHAVVALPELAGAGAAAAMEAEKEAAERWLARPKNTRLLAEGTQYGSAVGVLRGKAEMWSSRNPNKVYTVKAGELAIVRPGQPPVITPVEFDPDIITDAGELNGIWWYLPPLAFPPPKTAGAGGLVCPSCHRPVEPNRKYCIYCGTRTRPTPPEQGAEKPAKCAKCGEPIRPGKKFCIKCGTKHETTSEEKRHIGTGQLRCAKCGEPIRAGKKFCMKCGTPVNRS